MTTRQPKTAKIKAPYAPAISRLLSLAYNRRAVRENGEWRYGFRVRKGEEAGTVEILQAWGIAGRPDVRSVHHLFSKYADTLIAAGYAAEFDGYVLTVRAVGTPVYATAEILGGARHLGKVHRKYGRRPFGEADYVRDDAGSADLMTALHQITPTTEDNHAARVDIVLTYCAALEGLAA
jgi:hypothetical protein